MRYLHTLDPNDFLSWEEYLAAEDAQRAAELAAEDAAMDRYYDHQ